MGGGLGQGGGKGGATRLDGLLGLLDKGSNASVRRMAATQIGELTAAHPTESRPVLRRVRRLLLSPSWDTRVAAGHALAAIAGQTPRFQPTAKPEATFTADGSLGTGTGMSETTLEPDVAKKDEPVLVKQEKIEDEIQPALGAPRDVEAPAEAFMDEAWTDALRFAQLDIARIIQSGAMLLGSSGDEYNRVEMDVNEQRARLKAELGLDDRVMGGDEILKFEDTDFASAPGSDPNLRGAPASTERPDELVDDIATQSLSARERNRLKREAKKRARSGSSLVPSAGGGKRPRTGNGAADASDARPGGASTGEINDGQEGYEEQYDAKYCDFQPTCEVLKTALLDLRWEARHGAAIGLRQIISVHAESVGRRSLDVDVADRENGNWLEDICCRLVCVLAMDRFGDFVGDAVVAPVRETAAMAMAAASRVLAQDQVVALVRLLLALLESEQALKQWEVRHAVLLGVRYILAVHAGSGLSDELLPIAFAQILNGLRDVDDDVRAVASEALFPIAEQIVTVIPHRIPGLVATLWDALLDLDDISASTGSVLRLLTEILQHSPPPSIARLWLVPTEFDDGSDPSGTEDGGAGAEPESTNGASVSDDKSFSQLPLLHLIPRIFPFLRNGSLAVRLAAVKLLETLVPKQSENEEDMRWLRILCGETMESLFGSLLLENDSGVLTATKQVWSATLSCMSARPEDVQRIVDTSSPLISHWLQAASHESRTDAAAFNQARNAKDGKAGPRRRRSAAAARRAAKAKAARGGIGQSRIFGYSEEGHVPAPAVEGRYEGVAMQHSVADAVGRIAAKWPVGDPRLVDDIVTALQSPFSVSRRVACDVLRCWAIFGGSSAVLVDPLRIAVTSEMDGSSSCQYAEVGVIANAFFTDTTSLLDAIGSVFAGAVDVASLRGNCDIGKIALAGHDYTTAAMTARALHPYVQDVVANKWVLLEAHVAEENVPKRRAELFVALRQRILTSLGYMAERNDELSVSLSASASSALIAFESLSLPDKVGPFIKALTASARKSKNPHSQEVAAQSLATLSKRLTARGKAKPLQLLLKNLTKYLTADPLPPKVEKTNNAPPARGGRGGRGSRGGRGRPRGKRGGAASSARDSVTDGLNASTIAEGLDAVEVTRRGARMTFYAFCSCFGESIFDSLPWIWDVIMIGCDRNTNRSHAERLDGLTILRTIVGRLPVFLHDKISGHVPSVILCCTDANDSISELSVKCLADVVSALPSRGMRDVIHHLLPLLTDSHGTQSEAGRKARRGASKALRAIVDRLGSLLVPYAAFLIVPVMMRMVDDDPVVRDASSGIFGVLVRLMPLEGGAPDDPEMSASMSAERGEARVFLGQLLGTHPRSHYEMPVPIGDGVTLRKYQQECLDWLAFLNRYGLHGALCDDMGLGKTLMTLCIMAGSRVDMQRAEEKRVAASGQASTQVLCPSLVVCPSTIAAHWVQECERFFGTALNPVILYSGPPRVRARIRATTALDQAGLVVTSYDVLSSDLQHFSHIRWNYLSLDEGHVIKNPKTKVAKAVRALSPAHRLVLTGTPIQNSVLELWSLFDFLMPGFLGSELSFKETYAKPIQASRGSECTEGDRERGLIATEALHRQVLPFVLRRLKDDVLSELPPKIMQDYFCNMTPLQVGLYEDFSRDIRQKGLDAVESDGGETGGGSRKTEGSHVFKVLSYLRRLCSHPKLVLGPEHPEFVRVTQELAAKGRSIDDIESSAKMIGLRNILHECGIGDETLIGGGRESGGHRVLIFAQLKQMLDLVETDLFRNHMPSVTYLRLDGSVIVANRQTIVTRFNADPTIDCLLLTTSVGGLGLNLVGADTVIFLEHDWNPTKDLQAMDRAHRMGQKRTVNVYRLITRGTLEEKIMGIQKFKTHIANTVVNRDNSSLQSMNTETLLSLFHVDGEAEGDDGGKTLGTNEGKGMKAALAGLGELWEEKQYEDEYDMDSFLAGMKGQSKQSERADPGIVEDGGSN